MNDDLLYNVALGNIPKVGSKNAKSLIAYCGSAEKIFKTPKGKLLKIPGIGEKIASSILQKDTLAFAEKEIERALKDNVRLLFFTDKEYPNRLKQINDAPPLIYYKGNADLENSKILSVVGTRNITSYGKRICEQILDDLKNQNILIVSGLAYGVDICAHKSALKNQLPTVGIMANGLDKVYPAQHKNSITEMLENGGGIITEESYGTPASPQRFPARNRIVAGIADATLVIESAVKGGSLITANIAFSYDKEVLAVPGEIDKQYSIGCNNLIKENKAQLVTSSEDILKHMNWDLENKPSIKNTVATMEFEGEELRIVNLLQKETEQTIDEIAWKLQLSPNKLASTLLNLEFSGYIITLPGKKYRLK